MDCFHHAGAASVGVCKACGKGVCHKCVYAAPTVVCCEACAAQEADYARIIQWNMKAIHPKRWFRVDLVFMMFGLILGADLFYEYFVKGFHPLFMEYFLCFMFLSIGVLSYFQTRKS